MRLKQALYSSISHSHRGAVRIVSGAVDCTSAKMSLPGYLLKTCKNVTVPLINLENSFRAQDIQSNPSIAEGEVGLS